MNKYPDQRIAIFVDAQNLYHSAKNLFQARVNFKAILDAVVAGRKLITANAYVITSPTGEESKFFEALDKQGFTVKTKDLQIFMGGAKKADWDVGMAIDAIKMAPRLDAVVLVTGDGDFVPLVEYLQNSGIWVEAATFGESSSRNLREAVDHFIDLSQDKNQFLMRSKILEKSKIKRPFFKK